MNGVPHSQLAPLPLNVPFRLVSRTIGTGAYACIKKAAPLHKENPVFAVKFINKNYAQKYGRIKQKQLQMEVTLHKHVGLHRNIIEYFDNGEDDAWMWIAMELAEGGDLFDKIEADSGVSEDIAHVYFTQLVNAISYMHSKGVGHRDIKPENILLSADGDLKLADFGMATLFEYHGKRKLAVTLCGSPPYVAPEVLTCSTHAGNKGGGYAADAADIWSCGVVLFVLLAGNTPWSKPVEGRDEDGQLNEFSEYVQTKGHPNDEYWQSLPIEVLSLLRGMMQLDTAKRYSMEEVRRHPWFTRKNKYMDKDGSLVDQISLATNMFESLKVSLDEPVTYTLSSDAMDVDIPSRSRFALPLTQPETPAEDMLFDWEKPQRLALPSTQPTTLSSHIPSTQAVYNYLEDEPSMSQFAATPSVPMSRTQQARRFRDILPAQSLTKFYSVWSLGLLVPLIMEALSRLGVPTPGLPRPSAHATECTIKVRTQDSRACPLSGNIFAELIMDEVIEVSFIKGSGDPLEWRRFFKKVTLLCKDAVHKPDE